MTIHIDPHSDVVVVGDGCALDAAVIALVEKCGHAASLMGIRELGLRRPRVVLVRDEATLTRAVGELCGTAAVFVCLTRPSGRSYRSHGGRVRWLGGRDAAAELTKILHKEVALATLVPGQVELTGREIEVVGHYALGATRAATAAKFFIAGDTVKTHFDRVKGKYALAGRPVSNKAQVLVAMMADGWIAPIGDGNAARGHEVVAVGSAGQAA